jgi:hypothetical protein
MSSKEFSKIWCQRLFSTRLSNHYFGVLKGGLQLQMRPHDASISPAPTFGLIYE